MVVQYSGSGTPNVVLNVSGLLRVPILILITRSGGSFKTVWHNSCVQSIFFSQISSCLHLGYARCYEFFTINNYCHQQTYIKMEVKLIFFRFQICITVVPALCSSQLLFYGLNEVGSVLCFWKFASLTSTDKIWTAKILKCPQRSKGLNFEIHYTAYWPKTERLIYVSVVY